jgi:hypothetical protein
MVRRLTASILLLAAVTWTCTATALENRGADAITMDGGSRGVVPFPHHLHQSTLGDCNVCHGLFPQELGAIVRLKQEGTLAGKQIMNKHCVKCHRAEKKAGNKSGPTSCAQCHKKG